MRLTRSASAADLHVEKLLDVGAGDEAVRLAGDQHHALDERILIDAREHALELADQRRAERVHRLARHVDRDDEDVVVDVRRRASAQRASVDADGRRHARSITIA